MRFDRIEDRKYGKNNENRTQRLKEKNITNTFKVNHSCELMEFLLTKCHTSRNNVKSLLSGKKILVNGSPVSQFNFMLVKDDEVKLTKSSNNKINAVNENFKSKKISNEKFSRLPFKIIYEDDDFIAIDKPFGLLSVESDKESVCAYSYLLQYFQSKSKLLRPYILHRIDKETSGVLVFAKNPIIHSMLKTNWNELVKTREYFAIVEGKIEKDSGVISSYLKENANNIVYSSFDGTGKKAVTHYEVVNKNDDYTLLKVNIDSGRKNQIRVHMKDINHNIIGDDKYGHTKNPLKRLGLHASKLEFINPKTNKLVSILAKVPENFYTLIK